MITPTPADTEVRQLVVHPTVWPYLTAWLDARSIDVNLMTPASDDDLATYVMSPRPRHRARGPRRACPAPAGAPRSRPRGPAGKPDTLSGPQMGVDAPTLRALLDDAMREHLAGSDGQFAEALDAVLGIVLPIGRHLGALHQSAEDDLTAALATLKRVRQLADLHHVEGDNCVASVPLHHLDRALAGADTPKATQ